MTLGIEEIINEKLLTLHSQGEKRRKLKGNSVLSAANKTPLVSPILIHLIHGSQIDGALRIVHSGVFVLSSVGRIVRRSPFAHGHLSQRRIYYTESLLLRSFTVNIVT